MIANLLSFMLSIKNNSAQAINGMVQDIHKDVIQYRFSFFDVLFII